MKKRSASKDKEEALVIDINSSFYKYYEPNALQHQPSKFSNYQLINQNISAQNSLFFTGNSNSMEKCMTIPVNMLSQDCFNPRFINLNKQNSRGSQVKYEAESQKQFVLGEKQQQLLINSVLAAEVLDKNDKDQKTKNILRNIGNAQNQFISHTQKAAKIIQQQIKDPQKFKKWVRSFQLQNFKQFQQIWTNYQNRAFVRVYKKLCRIFYVEHAIPYILNSRMKGEKTKYTHLKYLYKFLQGVDNASQFNCFKAKTVRQREMT